MSADGSSRLAGPELAKEGPAWRQRLAKGLATGYKVHPVFGPVITGMGAIGLVMSLESLTVHLRHHHWHWTGHGGGFTNLGLICLFLGMVAQNFRPPVSSARAITGWCLAIAAIGFCIAQRVVGF